METMHLFNAHDARSEGVDAVVDVQPNLWLLTSEEIPPLLFTPEEAARLLMVGREKVYKLIQRRELRSIKVGQSRRISARALSEYVAVMEAREPA